MVSQRSRGEEREKIATRYLQHHVGRGIVPAVGCIKVTRQADGLAVGANVDIYRRTVDTVEASTDNILLTTAPASEKRHWYI